MKGHTKILIYYIGYATFKDLSSVKIKSANPVYINGYIEKSNGNGYLMLVPAD